MKKHDITIDGMCFQVFEMEFDKAFSQEAKILEIIGPALELIDSLDLTEMSKMSKMKADLVAFLANKMSFKEIGSTLTQVLKAINKAGPFLLFSELVQECQYIEGSFTSARGKISLGDKEGINKVFRKKTMTFLKLAFKVMQINEFAFIKGLVGGDETEETNTLRLRTEEAKK